MPLYDFLCDQCGHAETFLMGYQDGHPKCPKCGSGSFNKQFSPFAASGLTTKSQDSASMVDRQSAVPPRETIAAKEGGTDHSSCSKKHSGSKHSKCSGGHANHDAGSRCAASRIDQLIARHDKVAKPINVRSS